MHPAIRYIVYGLVFGMISQVVGLTSWIGKIWLNSWIRNQIAQYPYEAIIFLFLAIGCFVFAFRVKDDVQDKED